MSQSINMERLAIVDGWGPKRDNTGLVSDFDSNANPELRIDYPEVAPYRGYTQQVAYVCIPGSEVTGYNNDPGAFNGPSAGSLVFLWLVMKNGRVSDLGDWVQLGTQDRNGWFINRLPTDPPIPDIGGWEFIGGRDTGDGGPKVLAYYRIITEKEQEKAVTWRIRTTGSGNVFSQVWYNVIRPGYFVSPFAPVARARGLVNTRSLSTPGIQTTTSTGFSSTKYAGGNAVLTASALVGSFDNALTPNGGYYLLPGNYGNEEYGSSAYVAYAQPWNWMWFFGWTTGLPDNVTVPDGPIGTQKAAAPDLHYAALTVSFPSPPNVDVPIVENPISGIVNNFEVDNMSSFFTVSGSGTPVIG